MQGRSRRAAGACARPRRIGQILVAVSTASLLATKPEEVSAEFPMKDFIDFQGASGASYRFRLWPEGAPHQPIAGNYVCVRASGDGFAVVSVGETLDLSGLRQALPKRVREATTHIYTRLNVARAVRTAEHEDLLARNGSAKARASANAA